MIYLARFILAAALFALSACSGSTDPDSRPQSPTIAQEVGAPALWKLADEDTSIYLFGTVHVLKPETDWQTIEFAQVFSEADVLYLEADVTSEDVLQRLPGLVASLAPFTNGKILTDLLDDEGEREVREAADLLGIPMQSLMTFRPWFVGLTLSQTQTQQAGYLDRSGVDNILEAEAKLTGKPIRYLETAEDQIRTLAGFSDEAASNFLVETAIAIEDEPDLLGELIAEWAVGDIPGLAALIDEDEAFGAEEVRSALLTRRNRNWTDQLTTLMQDEAGTFLVAVGAAHLVGEDSVQSMLEAEGYQVTRQ